jgi:uncharacterized membrane protein YwzB
MDELVAVGTAGLLGLILTALLLAGVTWWVAARVWNAFVTGDWWTDVEILLILVMLAMGYTVTGIWLQKTGRI